MRQGTIETRIDEIVQSFSNEYVGLTNGERTILKTNIAALITEILIDKGVYDNA